MTHQPPASQFKAPVSIDAVLQEIHDQINALGGTNPRDDIDRAIIETVSKALDVIEAKQREVA
jgi:hypothetical protein